MYIKKYKTHLSIGIGKRWVQIDRTGVMAWTGKRNMFWIWKHE